MTDKIKIEPFRGAGPTLVDFVDTLALRARQAGFWAFRSKSLLVSVPLIRETPPLGAPRKKHAGSLSNWEVKESKFTATHKVYG